MDKPPFDAIKFTDTVLKKSRNIKLSLEADPLELDESLLDLMPCPQIKYIETSESADASIEQLSMWSQQLLQLEESVGIIKTPKARGLDTTRSNRSFLHRSVSVPQLNQTKAKLHETIQVPQTPKKVNVELTKQMLSEYYKKKSANRSGGGTIDKKLINGVCSGLDDLTHLFADVKVEYEKKPVFEVKENEELSNWLADINQVKQLLEFYNLIVFLIDNIFHSGHNKYQHSGS